MEFHHFQMENLTHYWEILGPMYISFLGSRSLEFMFVRACFKVIFHRFLSRNFAAGDSKIKIFARKVLHKSIVH